MLTNKDYYRVLGVLRDASEDDIRHEFRKLAMRYHPDRNKNLDAEERFKEINEANQVLSDPVKRWQYDSFARSVMMMLVCYEDQRTPATLYGNAQFGRGNFVIRVCQNPTVILEKLGRDKAMFYHFP